MRSVLASVLARLQHACVGSAFDGWVSAIKQWRADRERIEHEQTVIKRAIMRMQSVCLSLAFDGWYTGTVERIRLVRVAGIVMSRLVHACKAKCLLSWCDYVSSVQRVKQFMMRAGQRIHGQTLAFVWQSWRDFHHDLVKERLDGVWTQAKLDAATRIAGHWSQRRVSKCFHSWEQHWQTAVHLRHVLRYTLQKMRLGTVSRCVAVWRQHAKVSKSHTNLLRRALRWIQNRLVASAFLAWFERTETSLMRKQRVQQLLLRWANAGAARAFDRWRLRWEQIAKARYCMRRVQHRVIWQCINRWRDLVDAAANHRHIQTKILLRLRQIHLASVWDRWSLRAWQRRQLLKIVCRMRLARLHRAMDGWQHATRISAAQGIRASREQEIAVIHRIYSNQIARVGSFVAAGWRRKVFLCAWFGWRLAARNRYKHINQGDRFLFFLRRRDSALVVSSCFYHWLRQYQVGTWTKYYTDEVLYDISKDWGRQPSQDDSGGGSSSSLTAQQQQQQQLDRAESFHLMSRPASNPAAVPSSIWLQQAVTNARAPLDQAARVHQLSKSRSRRATASHFRGADDYPADTVPALQRKQSPTRVLQSTRTRWQQQRSEQDHA